MAVTATASASNSQKEDTPAFTSMLYREQAPRWQICRDLMLGTETIRDKPDIYLVRGAAELDGEFDVRSRRAECFPMFKETIKGMTGLVFRKDPILEDDVPPQLRDLWENIDGAGTHGAVFTRQVFEDALQTGHAGILVDMPTSPAPDRALMIGEEQDLGMRPYWLHIKAEQIINWRTDVLNGVTILTLLVIKERAVAPVGDFMTTIISRYRVYRRDLVTGAVSVSVYEFGDDTSMEYTELEQGVLRNVQAIPFALVYAGQRRAPLVSFPPLIDLAYTNISHWNVLSDHRTSLHAAGNPILVTIGREATVPDPNRQNFDASSIDVSTPEGLAAYRSMSDDDDGEVMVIGPSMGINLPVGGDAKYIEHQGHALAASQNELQEIEKRGAAQGLSLIRPDTRGAETAEAKRLDHVQQDASLSRAARSMQDCTEQALEYMAQFVALPSGGSVRYNADFQDLVMDTTLFEALSKSTLAGQLSLPTFWQLLVAGNILPDDFDADSELAILESQSAGIKLGAGLTVASPGVAIPAPVAPALQQSLPPDATLADDEQVSRTPSQTDTGAGGDLTGDPALGNGTSVLPIGAGGSGQAMAGVN